VTSCPGPRAVGRPYATLSAMGVLLMTCGLILAGVCTWSGYRNAREAIAPVADPGDSTRSAIEAARPPYARPSVRRFARSVAIAVGWLVLAHYGLFLVSIGSVAGGPG
jgi:hypothetical protein